MSKRRDEGDEYVVSLYVSRLGSRGPAGKMNDEISIQGIFTPAAAKAICESLKPIIEEFEAKAAEAKAEVTT